MKVQAAAVAAVLCLVGSAPAEAAVDLTIYSWENTADGFFYNGGPVTGTDVPVQNTDSLGITHGDYSAEVITHSTTNFYRGAYSASLADQLKGNSVLKVDFAVKDPDTVSTFKNVILSIIVAGRNSDGTGFFSVEGGALRAQAGTAVFDYGAASPALLAGVGQARIEFRVLRQGGFTGSVYFDNLRVETVPEPASLALASLGGVLLLRRRR